MAFRVWYKHFGITFYPFVLQFNGVYSIQWFDILLLRTNNNHNTETITILNLKEGHVLVNKRYVEIGIFPDHAVKLFFYVCYILFFLLS